MFIQQKNYNKQKLTMGPKSIFVGQKLKDNLMQKEAG